MFMIAYRNAKIRWHDSKIVCCCYDAVDLELPILTMGQVVQNNSYISMLLAPVVYIPTDYPKSMAKSTLTIDT